MINDCEFIERKLVNTGDEFRVTFPNSVYIVIIADKDNGSSGTGSTYMTSSF